MTVSQLPKYKKIKRAVLQNIRSGKLRAGDKLPIRTELMQTYSTTRVTLDKALNELIDEKILTASRRAGTFVASQHRAQKIAIINEVSDPVQGQLLQRYNYFDMYVLLQNLLKERTVETLSPARVLAEPNILRDFDFILTNSLSEQELDKISTVQGNHGRFVPLNRPFDGYNYVSTDHRQSAQDLTGLFLKELPPESEIIYLDVKFAEPFYVESVPELRKKGFIDACAEYRRFYRLVNVKLEKRHKYSECNVVDISELQALSLKGAAPACIISPSKCFTSSVLRYLNENGLKLNKNVYYADFDNYNSQMDTGYAITSVLEDFAGIAETAAEMISAEEQYPRIIPHHIVNNPFPKLRGEK